ncbi:hypothetical protein [Endozoicomonas ascidiicola]|uniref:hypothetical protein n=1 Tax=Endozoicomonas ascidiicola TaxID=1698521 RepID=UPI000831A32E|nr:hypothetical protein [Endozoicomonas ascidiicola]
MSTTIVYQLTQSVTTSHKLQLTSEGEKQWGELQTDLERRQFIKDRFRSAQEVLKKVSDAPAPKNIMFWKE